MLRKEWVLVRITRKIRKLSIRYSMVIQVAVWRNGPCRDPRLSGLDAGAHSFGRDSMAIFEKASEFSMDEPAGKKITDETQRQLILNAVS